MMKKAVWLGLCFVSEIAVAFGDYFELRGGLDNARYTFEQTGHGRVAFLGGSITDMTGWRDIICEDLQQRFPNTEFDFIEAGIPSTGSTPGAFRMVRDCFKNGQVDLLFEEAAVNDRYNGRSSEEQIRAMEGIVRHARDLNPNIDVVFMYFADPYKVDDYTNGITPEVIVNHDSVAAHYNIPSVNQAEETADGIANGDFTWEDDFVSIHPATFGQELYAAAISRMFDAAWPSNSAPSSLVSWSQPAMMDSYSYDVGNLLLPAAAENLNGFEVDPSWVNTVGGSTREGFVNVPMLVGESAGDSFSLTFEGRAFGLFVAAGPDAGIVEYRIDGGSWQTQDLFTAWSSSLHIPWLYVLSAELDAETNHVAEVRIATTNNASSTGYACRIVNFAVNTTNGVVIPEPPGEISWNVEQIADTGTAQISTNGMLVEARVLGSTDTVATTLGGVMFDRLVYTPDFSVAPYLGANLLTASGVINAAIYSRGVNPDYAALLGGYRYYRTLDSERTISGLTPGNEYQLQLFVADLRNITGPEDRYVEIDGTAYSTNGMIGSDGEGSGTVLTGTFTATSATQPFTLNLYDPTNEANVQGWTINAYQLRDITPPAHPVPATISLSSIDGNLMLAAAGMEGHSSVINTLQMKSSLTSGDWVDLGSVSGVSATNWPLPTDGTQGFFRILSSN